MRSTQAYLTFIIQLDNYESIPINIIKPEIIFVLFVNTRYIALKLKNNKTIVT